MGKFFGASWVNSSDDHVFVKEAGTLVLTDWHQDLPYMAVDGQMCTNGIPLFGVGEELCVEFSRGAHKRNRWFGPIDSLADGSHCPGDVLYIHGLKLHQGRANTTTDQMCRSPTHRGLS